MARVNHFAFAHIPFCLDTDPCTVVGAISISGRPIDSARHAGGPAKLDSGNPQCGEGERYADGDPTHSRAVASLGLQWFKDEYGPGFGASLAAAYQRDTLDLELTLKTIFEGNVQRGWITPKILRYTDPETVNAPLDHFLNCMDQIVPLYATGFQGETMTLSVAVSRKPGVKSTQSAGDPDGYFIYDHGGFRFVPMDVLNAASARTTCPN